MSKTKHFGIILKQNQAKQAGAKNFTELLVGFSKDALPSARAETLRFSLLLGRIIQNN